MTAAPVHQHTHQIRIVNLNPKSTGKMSCEEGLDGSLATLFAQAVVSNSNRDDDGLRVNHLKLTPAAVVERVYFLGRIISNVFEETNLHYWTSGGTTLGAMRHRGLIPWDDDLDLCILKENMHFFLNEVAPKLHGEHGVVCQETCFGYRLFHRTNSDAIASQINHRHPFCDVFVMRRTQLEDNFMVECAFATARCLYPKECYPFRDIAEPILVPFGDFHFRLPANAELYLNNYYGSNWKNIAETQNYCHLTQERVCPVSFTLTTKLEP